ncbi:hypothetical protein M885DRAFT_536323 [Pelagophyceae sp. CCMP2097]|nr:hypothetical protein M885DRAFT_536323 [Pelagophyceae sp. CCMP2097]|mmetsp:Transcript_21924/g.75906  ORF Transcript_21924/g.75906 Transcript_21924/m.75906 type:complete len:514 (-) Transcript_21924:44-1585(-)
MNRLRLVAAAAARRAAPATTSARRSLSSLIPGANGAANESPASVAALQVLEQCAALHRKDIAPLNKLLLGPLERSDLQQQTALPFVLLLGNHSSGKSSFVNHVFGRKIQTAGVAPTDDSFTVISPGTADFDRDGPALVSDPDLGFSGLRSFGPGLTHHMALKIRSGLSTNSFMMVDSPGMIDSAATAGLAKKSDSDRGYHFEGAVRWFAERADVILLFFDPDKPGTTGETLTILTNALQGTDHKLHIILNKADRFERMHDFARAYGALCWNLAKVIPRKDLPRIYTMCVPSDERDGSQPRQHLIGLEDLANTREEVLAEVRNAPSRRVDNTITRLTDSAQLLLMHASVCDAARKAANRKRAALWLGTGGAVSAISATGVALAMSPLAGVAPAAFAAVGALGLAGVGAWHYVAAKSTAQYLRDLESPQGLQHLYSQTYARALADGDDESAATWRRVKPHITATLEALGGAACAPQAPRSAIAALRRILDHDAPELRRLSAPMDFAKARAWGRMF